VSFARWPNADDSDKLLFSMTRFSASPLAVALALVLAFANCAFGLKVESAMWGFDGKVVAGKFNLLSVLVSHSGGTAYDGEISLQEYSGTQSPIGAPQVQKIYVTPGTQRWVQFTPFTTSEANGWKLRWQKGAHDLDAPTLDAPATVLLIDAASPYATRAQLRAFAEDLFPTSVAATDGLDQLVLDHVPRWDGPRREAFLDWLRKGGVVHVLRGAEGHPVFEGELEILNTAAPKARVGAGSVVRHDITRAECNDTFLAKAGFPIRGNVNEQGTYPVFYGFHQSLLQKLAGLTRPNVQWWLLYLLTIAYLVVIGPVHYRWSRKVDYRLAIGGFLGTVGVFSVAFMLGGSRGAGEIQTAHTVSIAQPLGGKRWDVMQWSCAFATSGNRYRLTHEAPWNSYSAPSESEAVNGYAAIGKGGFLEVDIPLYSSRPYVHRAVMDGPDADLQIVEWKPDRIVLKPGKELPGKFIDCIARWSDRVMPLKSEGGNWVWVDKDGARPLSEFFSDTALQRFGFDGRRSFVARDVFVPLTAMHYGDLKGLPNRVSRRPFPADHMQVLLWADAPESFAMRGKGFHDEEGWVLYVLNVFRPQP
jgi:hypothetical protein